jgi:phosphate transport system protein
MNTTTGARHLQDDLATLRRRLLEMAEMAEEQMRTATEAITDLDEEKARRVIGADRALDLVELDLDDYCIRLLALHQPVARDLRLITMAMRIVNDLERIGDHAVNIAETVVQMRQYPSIGRFRDLDEMATLSGQMLIRALDSFVRGDAALAREVCSADDQVDDLQDTLFRLLLTHMMEDPKRIGPAMSLILVSRNLERIADLATNIAKDVVYLVEGRTIKHGGISGP